MLNFDGAKLGILPVFCRSWGRKNQIFFREGGVVESNNKCKIRKGV